jgi:hypothetical protein
MGSAEDIVGSDQNFLSEIIREYKHTPPRKHGTHLKSFDMNVPSLHTHSLTAMAPTYPVDLDGPQGEHAVLEELGL